MTDHKPESGGIARHYCGQTQLHSAHVWQAPPIYGSTTFVSTYQCAGLRVEAYTVEQIREAYKKHASPDDWGVPAFYEGGLIAALRGEYDVADPSGATA